MPKLDAVAPPASPAQVRALAKGPVYSPMPSPTEPMSVEKSEIEKIRKKTRWGILAARIGSRHSFQVREPEMVPDEAGVMLPTGAEIVSTHEREVRDVSKFPGVEVHCVCITCGVKTGSVEQMIRIHEENNGDIKKMVARSVRHVYALECDETRRELVRGFDPEGRPKSEWRDVPIGLLSSVGMAD